MPQATIARIESGERAVRVDDLYRLAAVFGLAPAELVSSKTPPKPHAVQKLEDMDGIRQELAALSRQVAALSARLEGGDGNG